MDIKTEITKAYDEVGSTADREGDLIRARVVMKSLGYTESQIEIAGEDAYNYQGVGNPHKHAHIEKGLLIK